MRNPLVTAITAVRNGEAYLAETIASIQAQDFGDWEYIIVDDASTDGTAEVIRRASEADPRVHLLRRRESAGPYAAANDAVRIGRGRYIMRTDGDDLQPANRFSQQLRYLAEHGEYRACVTYWQGWNERGLIPGSRTTLPQPRAFKWYLLLRSASIHSSLCIERDALVALGGYRELPLSQDYRLWCELTRRGWLGVLPETLSYVRFHEGRSTNRRAQLQKQLARDVLRDHWTALTGLACSDAELDTLWAVGYSLYWNLDRGLEMLARWDRLWAADLSLAADDRKELAALSELRRRKFLRSNLRRQPARTVLAALKAGFPPAPAAL